MCFHNKDKVTHGKVPELDRVSDNRLIAPRLLIPITTEDPTGPAMISAKSPGKKKSRTKNKSNVPVIKLDTVEKRMETYVDQGL
jgi:hypothetical protein